MQNTHVGSNDSCPREVTEKWVEDGKEGEKSQGISRGWY